MSGFVGFSVSYGITQAIQSQNPSKNNSFPCLIPPDPLPTSLTPNTAGEAPSQHSSLTHHTTSSNHCVSVIISSCLPIKDFATSAHLGNHCRMEERIRGCNLAWHQSQGRADTQPGPAPPLLLPPPYPLQKQTGSKECSDILRLPNYISTETTLLVILIKHRLFLANP